MFYVVGFLRLFNRGPKPLCLIHSQASVSWVLVIVSQFCVGLWCFSSQWEDNSRAVLTAHRFPFVGVSVTPVCNSVTPVCTLCNDAWTFVRLVEVTQYFTKEHPVSSFFFLLPV